MNKTDSIAEARPPIVAIVGHIDHGKSTLLDYIRNTNVVAGEAGGITQHLSAYEAVHQNAAGEHRITFLDTPGHAAFRAMRSRGLEAADVAILVVSAEEGAKPQTLEALALIQDAKLPFVVAFTKIDKPSANVEKAKMSLLEHNIFLEGMGGEVPWVAISGKTGEGVPELLDLILLSAELEGISADATLPGEGLVIEARVDRKRGNTATLIVRNGSIESGEFVVAGGAVAPVRIMENFLGKAIQEALPGSPIMIVGFSTLPAVGSTWHVVETKKDAEEDAVNFRSRALSLGRSGPLASPTKTWTSDVLGTSDVQEAEQIHLVLPLVIKSDTAGTGEAVLHELEKLPKDERLEVRLLSQGMGAISENDVKLVGGGKTPGLVVGFNVKIEKEAAELGMRLGVKIEMFNIIYKLAEYLAAELEQRRPRERAEEQVGRAKVLKFFSNAKGRVVVGGRVEDGTLKEGEEVKIMRRDVELGRGTIVSLQTQKTAVKKIESGSEFGAQIKTATLPAAGDYLETFEVVLK